MPCEHKTVVGTGYENPNLFYEAFGTDPLEILYQRRCANFIYVVPNGLRELLSDISREVLRMQPPNLHSFIADYLHTLMITRENAKIAMRLCEDVEDTSELLADLMKHTNMSRYQIDKSARIIQRTFKRLVKQRRYQRTELVQTIATSKMLLRLKVTLEEANKAASVIQRAYHTYKLRQERRLKIHEDPDLHMRFRHIDWLIAAQRTYDIFQHTRAVRMSELHKAAILIQSAYRGYYTRKYVKDYFLATKRIEKKLDPDDDCVKIKKNWAAKVIQRFFRRIVEENKRKRALFLVPKQTSIDAMAQSEFRELQNVLNQDKFLVKDTDILYVHATTSKDIEEVRDRSARVIQRFFRKIITLTKTKFNYDTVPADTVPAEPVAPTVQGKDTNVESDMYELDTEIEEIFEEDFDEENAFF